MVNVRVDTEKQLLRVLVSMKTFFPYIALLNLMITKILL